MGNALQTLFIAQLHVADQMFCEMLRQLTDNIATLQSAQLKHLVSMVQKLIQKKPPTCQPSK